jgi:hypothetical protein
MSRILFLEDFAAALTEALYRVVLRLQAEVLVVGFGVEPLEDPGPNDLSDDKRKTHS